ncbi:hypothetical protein ACHAXN_004389 [Cyclotella atomus]
MPPTITEKEDDAAPSAPSLSDSIPVVVAYAVPNDDLPAATTPPQQPPNLAVPQGMVAKTVNTKYADGREVTVTEFVPAAGNSNGTSANPTTANTNPTPSTSATASVPTNFIPRHDLGSAPVTFTCPFCAHAGPTRTRSDCGDCTWISVIILFLCCFPFFWVPFVCNNIQNTAVEIAGGL